MTSGPYDYPTESQRDRDPLSQRPTLRRPRRRVVIDERGRELYLAEDPIETPVTWAPLVPMLLIVFAGVAAVVLLLYAQGVIGGASLALRTPTPPSESPWQLEPKVTLAHVYSALEELEYAGMEELEATGEGASTTDAAAATSRDREAADGEAADRERIDSKDPEQDRVNVRGSDGDSEQQGLEEQGLESAQPADTDNPY